MSAGNAQPISISSPQSAPTPQITIYLNPAVPTSNDHSHHNQQSSSDHHQLMPPKIGVTSGETYQISPMQPVSSGDLQQAQQSFIHVTTHDTTVTTTPTVTAALSSSSLSSNASTTPGQNHQNQNINPQDQQKLQHHDQQVHRDQNSPSTTRFKWTEEKSQVAMNLVKYGCKPKLISVAVGCSLRTAQKFAETVTPKIEGESFKTYQIKRRGRKSKDVNQRLNAIREVLSKNASVTQVEIAADLKVSNTTVCRDLKRLGASWKEKKNGNNTSGNGMLENNNGDEQSTKKSETSQPTTARKTRQANSKNQNNNNTNDNTKSITKVKRSQRRNAKTNTSNSTSSNPDGGQDHVATNPVEIDIKPSD